MNKIKHILQILFLLTIITEIVKSQSDLTIRTDFSDSIIDEPESPEEKARRLCKETQPLKGIKEECYNGNEIENSNEVCCYMTIKYEANDHFACIAVTKDKSSIKNKIDEIKKEYEGSKSISIDCNSSLIRITLISFLLFLIF